MARSVAGTLMALAAAPGVSHALPADRGYELVTPPDKPAEYFSGYEGTAASATPNGDHLLFTSQLPVLPGSDQFPFDLRADRGTDGWTTVAPIPREQGGQPDAVAPVWFSHQDLSVLVETFGSFDPADQDSTSDIYRFFPDGTRQLMSPTEVPTSTNTSKQFAAADEPGDGVIVQNYGDPLLPVEAGASPGASQLYEYRGGLRAVGLDNSGSRLTDGDVLPGGLPPYAIQYNVYSRDGRRVFFSATSSGAPGDRPGLYVRTDGTRTDAIPQTPDGANASSQFLGATPDGAHVYFASSLQLTPDDHDSSTDLYEYDTADGTVHRLSVGPVDADVQIAPVLASDDGSRVYFTANGQLVPGAGSATGGKTYLYSGGDLHFVADAPVLEDALSNGGVPACAPDRVTPDGRFLLMQSGAPLTPDDADGGAQDVYRFDAVTGETVRVSSGPSDTNSPDDALIKSPDFVPGIEGCRRAMNASHPMSDDGRYVFFMTTAQLVPEDTNQALDVYMWDAATRTTSLISGGTGDHRSDFLDATPDGRSVFFITDAQLVPADQDTAVDVYDARIGGGFPASPPSAAPCSGASCQSTVSPPTFGLPQTSTTFHPASPGIGRAPLGVIRVRRLSAAQLRRLLRTGRARISVTPGKTGVVTVAIRVRTPAGWRRAGGGRRNGAAHRTEGITVTLSRAGHALLARYRSIRMVVHQSGLADVALQERLPKIGGR